MSDQYSPENVLRQLELSLSAGKWPVGAAAQGRRLLERLKSPVRVVLLGLPGSGKSQILNFIAGQEIIPPEADLPSLELIYGAKPHTTMMLEDESIRTFEHLDVAQGSDPATSFVRVELPLSILQKIALLEVVADDSLENQSDAISWALDRADIVLWCSSEFSSQERILWGKTPDQLKDHSFLVMTKADVAASQGILAKRIKGLQEIVADEFHSLIPVATHQAIAATMASDEGNKAALAASGGQALIDTVLRQAELGRLADIDSVLILLSRQGVRVEIVEQSDRDNLDSISDSDAHDSPKDQPLKDKTEDHQETIVDFCTKAIGYIEEHSADLMRVAAEEDIEESGDILEQCGDIANSIAEILTPDFQANSVVSQLQDDFLSAADTMLLMQMEEGVGAAADAVSLLLQMRRDLQQRLVA